MLTLHRLGWVGTAVRAFGGRASTSWLQNARRGTHLSALFRTPLLITQQLKTSNQSVSYPIRSTVSKETDNAVAQRSLSKEGILALDCEMVGHSFPAVSLEALLKRALPFQGHYQSWKRSCKSHSRRLRRAGEIRWVRETWDRSDRLPHGVRSTDSFWILLNLSVLLLLSVSVSHYLYHCLSLWFFG